MHHVALWMGAFATRNTGSSLPSRYLLHMMGSEYFGECYLKSIIFIRRLVLSESPNTGNIVVLCQLGHLAQVIALYTGNVRVQDTILGSPQGRSPTSSGPRFPMLF
ncbi:hypothetical protein PM082_003505 [Marasmius tenuissimus]|nr:hypothetical protein PM082_003505 [Marasmius tenuissimus]